MTTGDIGASDFAAKLNCETGWQTAIGVSYFKDASKSFRCGVNQGFSGNKSAHQRTVNRSGGVQHVVLSDPERGEVFQVGEKFDLQRAQVGDCYQRDRAND